jgi:hypothetical protein
VTAGRGPGVVVTLDKIYGKLLDVVDIVTVTKVHVEDITKDVEDHDRRLDALERGRWPLPSLGALLALAALAVSILRSS